MRKRYPNSPGVRISRARKGFAGGLVATGKAASGNSQLVPMTYSVQGDGSVRQYRQASVDHGQSRTDSFDLIYRRKDASE